MKNFRDSLKMQFLVINNNNGLKVPDKTQAMKGKNAHHVWFWHEHKRDIKTAKNQNSMH